MGYCKTTTVRMQFRYKGHVTLFLVNHIATLEVVIVPHSILCYQVLHYYTNFITGLSLPNSVIQDLMASPRYTFFSVNSKYV